MSVRTTVLARGTRGGSYWNTIYTCPTDVTALVKHVTITNAVGGTVGVLLYGNGSGTVVRLGGWTLNAGDTTNLATFWALRPTDRLILRWDTTNQLDWWISGAALYGTAPHLPQGPLYAAQLPGEPSLETSLTNRG